MKSPMNIYVCFIAVPSKIQIANNKKPYDPLQFTDNGSHKEAHHKLKLLEFDYKSLHDKRLQDVSMYLYVTDDEEYAIHIRCDRKMLH